MYLGSEVGVAKVGLRCWFSRVVGGMLASDEKLGCPIGWEGCYRIVSQVGVWARRDGGYLLWVVVRWLEIGRLSGFGEAVMPMGKDERRLFPFPFSLARGVPSGIMYACEQKEEHLGKLELESR